MHRVFHIANLRRPTHRVFGADLLPLTLGHLFLLREKGSVFLDDGFASQLNGQDLFDELLLGVFVCARPHRKARKELSSWLFPWFLRYWGWKYKGQWDVLFAGRIFQNYLSQSLSAPPSMSPPDGRITTTPVEWRLYAILLADFHLSPESALDTPAAAATALWAANADRLGRADFVRTDRTYTSLIDNVLTYHRAKLTQKEGNN